MSKRTIRWPGIVIGLLVLVLGGALWPQASNAAVGTLTIANNNESWNRGKFQRTGLASEQVGGVQLVPQNVARALARNPEPLPLGLNSQASVAYRDHVFILGGKTTTGGLSKTRTFIAGRLADVATGALVWTDYTPTAPLPQPLSGASAVIVELGGEPYLFVLGGLLANASVIDDTSSAAIYFIRLQADASGNLVPQGGWQTSAVKLPHQEVTSDGHGGGAYGMGVAVAAVNGTPNIYLFGGFNRTITSGAYSLEEEGVDSKVYRVPVTGGGGQVQLGAWEPMGDIQAVIDGAPQASPIRLYRMAPTTFVDPISGDTDVYLIGGTRVDNGRVFPSSEAYIAQIKSDGTMQWLNTGSMSATRSNHAATQADGQILVSGGTPDPLANPAFPDSSMGRGFINNDGTLYSEQPGAANFVLEQGAMADARMDHSMETLPASIYGNWYYVIGGQRQVGVGQFEPATAEVLIGNINDAPTQSDQFVSNGKYYSQVYDLGENTEFFELSWTTIMTQTGQGIELQYRIGNTLDTLGSLGATHFSVHGLNHLALPQPTTGRYFQFVATLGASASARSLTPILDAVALRLTRNGHPNLVPDGINMPALFPPGQARAPLVAVGNRPFNNQPLLDAAFSDGTDSFFVDVYVRTSATPPVLGDIGRAYAVVPKTALPANASYTIPAANWRPSSCAAQTTCAPVDWNNVFAQNGTYYIYVMVDSIDRAGLANNPFSYVQEAEAAGSDGESDNISSAYIVTVDPNAAPPPTATLASTAAAQTATTNVQTAQAGTPTATLSSTGAALTATSNAQTAQAASPTLASTGAALTATANAQRTASAGLSGPPKVFLPLISH